MKRLVLLLSLAAVGCDSTPAPPAAVAPKSSVELNDITYAGLDRAIADEKGRVVAVDVWATWCVPCVKKFPHFVAMHEKYAAKGLICISASTDEDETREKASKFLTEQKATFANYRLTENHDNVPAALKEKYPTVLQPILFVFNRAGVKVKEFKGKAKPEEIDAFVEELLAER